MRTALRSCFRVCAGPTGSVETSENSTRGRADAARRGLSAEAGQASLLGDDLRPPAGKELGDVVGGAPALVFPFAAVRGRISENCSRGGPGARRIRPGARGMVGEVGAQFPDVC